jgi:DNA-binding response OmpR family regulator
MADLAPEDLDRKVKLGPRELTLAELLMMAANQSLSHTGEIAALKGLQGAKGLPI